MHNKIFSIISEMQAIAQNGLTYGKDKYDLERYNRLMEITSNLASIVSGNELTEIFNIFSADIGYRTPKVDVRAAIFESNKILLVQEEDDLLWSLPGGWADINLSMAENAEKEALEESGIICKAIKLVGVYDNNKLNQNFKWPHVYKMIFRCKFLEGIPKNGVETVNAAFFDENNLPPLSPERITTSEIQRCFYDYKNPECPSYFE
ncbi:MAG: NUDIX hydrolase [Sphingobacteriia bacterium]|nr:NUDIX hydrolase [Sphingobacteriia bacterium]